MKEKKKKVSLIHSIVLKVVWCVIIAIVATCALQVWTFVPMIQRSISTNAENYMYDMSVAYGKTLECEIALEGVEKALAPEELQAVFKDVTIKCAESGYIYIVDAQGTMLYHPTADKIGQPVENEVVKGLIKELQSGVIPKPDIVTYDFKGVTKYASYFVGDDGSYILVTTADRDEIMREVSEVNVKAVAGGIFSLVICGAIGIVLASFVVKPINMLTKNVLKLAELDFTETENQKKLDKRKDETGQMSRAISVLRGELVKAFEQIKGQSVKLYTASEYLSSSASETSETVEQVERAVGEIADGATSQAQETQKATENVILIGNMVEETGTQVELLNTTASAMQQAGNAAMDTLQQLGDTNIRTREAINEIYEQTHTTNESALKIKEATSIITAIAEETNLLSLNASIEAARAGDQGRGFAVVASQIQKLAEQSNESARQIEDIIDSLIRDSEEAVSTMNNVKEIIAEQSENVERTGVGFEAVKKGIDTSIVGVKAISENISKLDEARINVVDVVQNLTAIAEENAAGTEETSASATEVSATVQNMAEEAGKLKEVAKGLERSMEIFKV
ncbi:MAG: methyl-accepting chemotaxis protein [Lachnospiraceae bacterium]|nr:methyl-accepting chemotaxis protein [Lachnospiraceae bacterium]